MRTGRQTVSIGGEDFTFYFETSGSKKGQGVTGEQDDRYYQSGKLLAAGSDEKYQVVKRTNRGTVQNPIYSYALVEDVDTLIANFTEGKGAGKYVKDTTVGGDVETDMGEKYNISNLNKDADELDELYVFNTDDSTGKWVTTGLGEEDYFHVNTSGRVVDNKGRSKDGNDYYFVTGNKGQILAIYLED